MRTPYFRNNSEVKADALRWSLGKLNNFQEVFGYNKLLWFFPVHTAVGDGITFPTQITISDASSYNSNEDYNNSSLQNNLGVTTKNSSVTDHTRIINMPSETKNNEDTSYLIQALPD